MATVDQTRVLIIRPDRIGDVILSTPVFEALRQSTPHCHIMAMVPEPVAPLLRGLPSINEVLVYEPEGQHRGLAGWRRLVQDIRLRNPQIAILLQTNFSLALAVFWAGVRYRIGPLSKLHSWLLFNRGVRQARSLVEMHEADYNLQLLRPLGIRVGARSVPTCVQLDPKSLEGAGEWLQEQGLDPDTGFVVVHPGMGGSALNWPEEHYIDLISKLSKRGYPVVVTAGAGERDLLARLGERLVQKVPDRPSDQVSGQQARSGKSDSAPIRFYGGIEARGISFLAALMAHSRVVVAPSTGPLHIAVALGKPVVTFYPPIRVQSANRWGPYYPDTDASSGREQAEVLVPEVYCGQDFKCLGSMCNYFPCMNGLTVQQTVEAVVKQWEFKV